MLSIFWTLAGLRPDSVFGVDVAKEADFKISDAALVSVEHQPAFFCSVQERFYIPIMLLLIFVMDTDVIRDPDHPGKILQDFFHSGLEEVL